MNQPMQRKDEREFDFTEENFQFLSKLAHQQTGIVLADHKRDMVYSRLARRLRALGLTCFTDYCTLLQSPEGQDEMSQLVNAITTNLTSFFREGHHFEHLRDELLLPMVKAGKQKRLRIWSAACSAGMEPYSIAMTVRSTVRDISSWDVKILATDIDSGMIETGNAGEYSDTELKNISQEYQQYLRHHKGNKRLQVVEDIKKLVLFRQLNLLEAWPMKGPFDAIFCRNVVIYFDKPTKQKLFERMAEILPLNGLLYIGHSESLNGISDRFESAGRTIYRRVK